MHWQGCNIRFIMGTTEVTLVQTWYKVADIKNLQIG